MAVARGAIGKGERSLKSVEDRGGADLPGGARKLIATMQPAARGHERRAVQLLQKFARGRLPDTRTERERFRGVHTFGLLGENAKNDCRVVCQTADAQHGVGSRGSGSSPSQRPS